MAEKSIEQQKGTIKQTDKLNVNDTKNEIEMDLNGQTEQKINGDNGLNLTTISLIATTTQISAENTSQPSQRTTNISTIDAKGYFIVIMSKTLSKT